MKITDIVNREVFKITECENEPIHIPGNIQPHGALIGVDEETASIKFCSANAAAFFGYEPKQLLNQLLSTLLPQASAMLDYFKASNDQLLTTPFVMKVGEQLLEATGYRDDELLIFEFERKQSGSANEQQLFEQTERFVSFIERAKSLQELCQNVANETRRITGYDRVMIYRFDKAYNGEVYAESREGDIEPFLGLHYPHTDIPPQARDLYLRNLMRMIGDVSYEPVPLLTTEENQQVQLDLSDSQLRSVSPIHIQYLKNMGVAATLTISLLQDGKLWGLIACHHRKPKILSFAQRRLALLQGHFLSSQIRVRQVAEEYEVNVTVEAHLQMLLNKIEAEEDFAQKFEQFTSLLAMTNATGAIILHNGELFEKGTVPPRDKTLALIKWLGTNIRSIHFSTSWLQTKYPEAESISKYAAGIIYQALGKPTENCIIWFREEMEKTVNWAGNPHDAVKKNPVTNMLTPRSSFAIWRERVRFQSKDWRVSEINAAIRFATSLQNYFHLVHLRNEDTKLRVLNDKLATANEELSNINWITSHDLKEPLRKIQIFASRILDHDSEQLSETLMHSINRINKSANRMQLLVEDILTYSIATDKGASFYVTDLNSLLEEVKENLAEEINLKEAIVQSGSLPVNARVIPHQFRQLFNNLIDNAVKFAHADRSPVISISCRMAKGIELPDPVLLPQTAYYVLSFADNGIGFDPTYRTKVFEIFSRLHSTDAYKGTGIGLAICKKIMENHNGALVAKATPGAGAVFTVYLPV